MLCRSRLAIVVPLASWIRTQRESALLWDYAKLRLPVTGPILQKIILARFANFFALMYQSGITDPGSDRTSEEIVGNRVIADGLQRARTADQRGRKPSETFQKSACFRRWSCA